MARVSVYVPDDMKARMDKAGEAANWSALAQRTFELELNYLETLKEISSMNGVIERLRASKAKFVESMSSEGRVCGAEWAKNEAEFDELRSISSSRANELLERHEDGMSLARELYEFVTKNDFFNDDDLAQFYQLGDDIAESLTLEFITGFVEGARDVWGEVSTQI